MTDLNKYKDHFILLLEAGFIAVNQADEDAALKLFRASELLNPNSTLSRVGVGYLHFHKLELKQAAEVFEEVLKKEPTNDMAKALLGLTMGMIPTEVGKGEEVLMDAAKTSDPQVKKVVDDSIDFIDTFVKKSKSPVEIRKNKE